MEEVGGSRNDIQYVVIPLAHQAFLSLEFPRQEYWSELPFPSPGDLTYSEVEPASLALQADFLILSHKGSPTYSVPWKKYQNIFHRINWKIKLRDILQKAL